MQENAKPWPVAPTLLWWFCFMEVSFMSIYSPCPATLFRTEWLHLSTRFCPPCSTLSSIVWETKTWKGAWGSWWAGGNPIQNLSGHVHRFCCWFLIHTTNSCKSAGMTHTWHRCWNVPTCLHIQQSTMETLWWFSIRIQVYQNLDFQFSYIYISLPTFLFFRKPHLYLL